MVVQQEPNKRQDQALYVSWYNTSFLLESVMSLEASIIDHICNVVRREIQEEFPKLTLTFIVHKPGEQLEALMAKAVEIKEHPAGTIFYRYLKNALQKPPPDKTSYFAGLSIEKEKKFLPFLGKRKALAIFFLNSNSFDDVDMIRQHAYNLAWHALNLLKKYNTQNTKSFREVTGVIHPKLDRAGFTFNNMVADIFSAVLLELMGEKGFIGAMARRNSQMLLSKQRGYEAEHYPYLLAIDATQIVFDEFTRTQSTNLQKPIALALKIAEEVGQTFDHNSIRQWWIFSRASQEMAWIGIDKSKILGAAVYSSEDPYVRSTAYLVAEALNIEPTFLSDTKSYNPFADQEANERHHIKFCETTIEHVIKRVEEDKSSMPFIEEAHRLNLLLIEGKPLGWCAPALMHAAKVYEHAAATTATQAVSPLRQAEQAFQESFEGLPWLEIQALHRKIIHYHRSGLPITPLILLKLAETDKDIQKFADAFDTGLDLPEKKPNKEPKKEDTCEDEIFKELGSTGGLEFL